MKPKICHLTSAHNRYDIRVFIKQCQSLSKSNYEVNLIVADGLGDELIEGVNIYDVGKQKNRFRRFLISTRKVYKKAKSLKCTIYHFHDPELMPFGLFLKSKKSKVIYDIHEDLVQQLKIRPWIPKKLKPVVSFLFEYFENFVVKRMDALLVPQPYMEKKYGKLNVNTVLVENFVILDHVIKTNEKYYNTNLAFHPGALSIERGLINMVNSYSYLDKNNKLYLAGNIKEDLLSDVANLKGWEKVEYLGVVPYEKVQSYYNKASIGLILYNNVGQYHLSYAIKLFEYMKNGIPVIMPNFGEWIEFNKENECGINVDPKNPIEVSNAINYLNNNILVKQKLGKNGITAVNEKYNWNISKSKLLKLYQKLLDSKKHTIKK